MLDVDSVTPFLLDRGLIPVSWVIDGDLTIRSAARRNRNLEVEGPGGTALLIKQPGDASEGGHETLRREARFYRFCREESAAAPMVRILPRLVCWDAEETILVLEWIPDAFCLWTGWGIPDGRGTSLEAARALGHALATVHGVFDGTALDQDPRLGWLPGTLPWVMTLHQPGTVLLSRLSAANAQTLRLLQVPGGMGEPLDAMAHQWRAATVIHGDMKFANVLIRSPRAGAEPGPVEVWIADWELVQIGDPAWDLAGVLQDFLVFWVFSMPIGDDLTAEAMIDQARVPLTAVRSAARAFWSGYRAEAGLAPDAADALVRRAVTFSGARLIQTAFELAVEADRLPGQSVLLLQISANLLAEPERGQVQLYGIPLSAFGL
ncbi:MAG TPA: phosphotransferase [Isosphaeraceae bacterium]|nr:phosphotransferase [Isosphaeraceae bacterium]